VVADAVLGVPPISRVKYGSIPSSSTYQARAAGMSSAKMLTVATPRSMNASSSGQMVPPRDAFADLAEPVRAVQQLAFRGRVQRRVPGPRPAGRRRRRRAAVRCRNPCAGTVSRPACRRRRRGRPPGRTTRGRRTVGCGRCRRRCTRRGSVPGRPARAAWDSPGPRPRSRRGTGTAAVRSADRRPRPARTGRRSSTGATSPARTAPRPGASRPRSGRASADDRQAAVTRPIDAAPYRGHGHPGGEHEVLPVRPVDPAQRTSVHTSPPSDSAPERYQFVWTRWQSATVTTTADSVTRRQRAGGPATGTTARRFARAQALICLRSPLAEMEILRGLACSATGMRRVRTPAS
jgi:hypothetical protein